VDDGQYVVNVDPGPENNSNAFAAYPEMTDYIFEVELKGDAGVDKGILFRCNDVSNSCYYINITANPVNIVSLGYLFNHVGVQLSAAPFPNDNESWYHAKIILSGCNIQVYVDGQYLIDYTANASTYIAKGRIGLSGYNGPGGIDTVRYDNVVVSGAFTQYIPFIVK
jgi:hypothetical protein